MNSKLPIKIDLPENFLDEEIRCDYTVSSKTKASWAVMIDLYVELKRVCDKYNLKMMADSGTTLGAARHKGFIPWDDDMDVMMPREDYEKLCKIAPSEFKHPYFWQDHNTDCGYNILHAQLRNSETTGILDFEFDYYKDITANQGIFIDIFVFDNVPDNLDERNNFLDEVIEQHGKLFKTNCWIHGANASKGIKKIIKEPLVDIANLVSKMNNYKIALYDVAANNLKKYDNTETECWSNLCVMATPYKVRGVKKKEWYKDKTSLPFEFITIDVPVGYENYLSHVYGDWKKFVKGTSAHGNVILEPYIPYKEYLKEHKK